MAASACDALTNGVQGSKKTDERVDLRGRKVRAVGRHIPSTLQYLVSGQPCCDRLKCTAALATKSAHRAAVSMALHLNNQAPKLQTRMAVVNALRFFRRPALARMIQ
jgi:hypothetical protein